MDIHAGTRGGKVPDVTVTRMVAVVLGGGVGTRFGAAMPKQLLTLAGKTLVEHCVGAFAEAPGIDDLCRNACPENGRGFILTERYFV